MRFLGFRSWSAGPLDGKSCELNKHSTEKIVFFLFHLASGGSKAGSWNHLKLHSLTCLVGDAGYWLEASLSLQVGLSIWSLHVISLGFLTAVPEQTS